MRAITDPSAAAASGVPHAAELLAYAEAVVRADEPTIERTRDALLAQVGPEGVVDAAAVIGNFQRMVRIADSTGIPLDDGMDMISEDITTGLGLDRFASSANTSVGPIKRWVGRAVRPLAERVLPHLLRRMGRSGPDRE